MEARFRFSCPLTVLQRNIAWRVCLCLVLGLFFCSIQLVFASGYQTPNFVIHGAPNQELAKRFGDAAEQYRRDLAVLWLGTPMPQWSAPCSVTVNVGNFGAGGKTFFVFNDGEVFQWEMNIQGTVDSILTAVLPHEITHTIFASHFREPVPRWIDEGGATTVENRAERQNYRHKLYTYLQTGRGIPFNEMFRLADYPDDVMPLYAQGFSLCEFLIAQHGHRHFIGFIGEGLHSGSWPNAVQNYYGYENLGELQQKWVNWVAAGCPEWDEIVSQEKSDMQMIAGTILPGHPPRLAATDLTVTGLAVTDSIQSVSYQERSNDSSAMTSVSPINSPFDQQLPNFQPHPLLAASIRPIPETSPLRQQSGIENTRVENMRENRVSSQVPQAVLAQPEEKIGPMIASPSGSMNFAVSPTQVQAAYSPRPENIGRLDTPQSAPPQQRYGSRMTSDVRLR